MQKCKNRRCNLFCRDEYCPKHTKIHPTIETLEALENARSTELTEEEKADINKLIKLNDKTRNY